MAEREGNKASSCIPFFDARLRLMVDLPEQVFEAADREIGDEEVGKKPKSGESDANEPLSMIKDMFGGDLPWGQSKGKNAS